MDPEVRGQRALERDIVLADAVMAAAEAAPGLQQAFVFQNVRSDAAKMWRCLTIRRS